MKLKDIFILLHSFSKNYDIDNSHRDCFPECKIISMNVKPWIDFYVNFETEEILSVRLEHEQTCYSYVSQPYVEKYMKEHRQLEEQWGEELIDNLVSMKEILTMIEGLKQ